MNQIEHILQIADEDARLIEKSFDLAKSVDELLPQTPPDSFLGRLGCALVATSTFAVVAGSIYLAVKDATDVVSGAGLRRPFEISLAKVDRESRLALSAARRTRRLHTKNARLVRRAAAVKKQSCRPVKKGPLPISGLVLFDV
jgi:hypothetical protein